MSSVRYASGRSSTAGVRQRRAQQQSILADQQQQFELQKQAQEAAARKRRSNLTIIIIISSIVAVIIIGVAVYFLIFRRSASSTSGGTGTGTGGSGTNVALGGACQTNTNCAAGLICSGLVCTNTPQSSCTDASHCPSGYACINHKCEGTIGATCSNNKDCQSPLWCNSQSCNVKTCSTQADCASLTDANGGQCNGTSCIGLKDGYCAHSADCAQPYGCDVTKGKCIAEPCTSGADCTNITGVGYCNLSNAVCALVPNEPCIENDQCDDNALNAPGGQIIAICGANGKCGEFGNLPCSVGTDCLSGSCVGTCTCTIDAHCNPAAGTPKCDTVSHTCVGCLTNTDCPVSTPHCNTVNHTCEHSCLTSADCTPPISCLTSGFCGLCTINADCPIATPTCCIGFNNPLFHSCLFAGQCTV